MQIWAGYTKSQKRFFFIENIFHKFLLKKALFSRCLGLGLFKMGEIWFEFLSSPYNYLALELVYDMNIYRKFPGQKLRVKERGEKNEMSLWVRQWSRKKGQRVLALWGTEGDSFGLGDGAAKLMALKWHVNLQ